MALQKQEQILCKALHTDLGKSKTEMMCEIGLVQGEIRWMKQHLGRLCRQKHVRTPLAQFAAKSYQSPSPYGNVLIMSPWNYPVLLTLEPLVDAIAAGNTAVVKPSAYAPASANVLKDLLEECFPPEYVAVVLGGREENQALLQEKFDKIFFTGSVAVGKQVMESAARHLTPVTLELGGKSPCSVWCHRNTAILCLSKSCLNLQITSCLICEILLPVIRRILISPGKKLSAT